MQVRAFLRWLFIEPSAVWFALGLPLISLLVALLLPLPLELGVRTAGYVLTLAGVVFIVASIRQKSALFERPSFVARAKTWLLRFPTFFGKPRSVHVIAGSGGISLSGHAPAVFVGAAAPRTLEERISAVEEDIQRLREQIAKSANELRAELRDVKDSTRRELSDLRAANRHLTGRVEELSVGSLDFELAAVAWVLFGSLYSTFPQELATFLGYVA